MKKYISSLIILIMLMFIARQSFGQEQKQPSGQDGHKATPPVFLKQPPGHGSQHFQPSSVDPNIIRASMKARAEYDALNRKVIARKQELYAENEAIKELQSDMRQLKKQIDEILAADEELSELKKEYESIAPQMPFGLDRQEPDPRRFQSPEQKNGGR